MSSFNVDVGTRSGKEPIVSFGVLTDVQYADSDCKPAWWNPDKTRYYRTALDHIDKAFSHWESGSTGPVQFALQLGDIIDGLNKTTCSSSSALADTLRHFENHSNIPTFHTVGNHELYNFRRQDLSHYFYTYLSHVNLPTQEFSSHRECYGDDLPVLYYKFHPVPGVKCISLDCFEVSVIGYEESHPRYKEAAEILSERHGHEIFEGWDCVDHLEGSDRRFGSSNGAVGQEQLDWLERELAESQRLGEKVIVFGHVSLSPASSDWDCVLWNYDEVVDVFHRHNCVVAYLCGHAHENGYAVDAHGIHYIVFSGIIETPPDEMAFATISLFDNRIQVHGYGREESRTLLLNPTMLGGSDVTHEPFQTITSPSVKVEV